MGYTRTTMMMPYSGDLPNRRKGLDGCVIYHKSSALQGDLNDSVDRSVPFAFLMASDPCWILPSFDERNEPKWIFVSDRPVEALCCCVIDC